MDHLYRVVPIADWHEALRTGLVPRCPADERHNRVHLNSLDDVELVANLWFTPEEEPVVLEVGLAGLIPHVRWEARTEPPEGVWPNLYTCAISTQNIVRVLTLTQTGDAQSRSFKIGPELPSRSQQGAVPTRAAP
jgi:uncharacterized protein (DUF952 family)